MEDIVKKGLEKLGKKATQKSLESLSKKEEIELNYFLQKERGNPKYDYFTINDYGYVSGEELFEFENLKEWDFADWKYQKEHQTTVREEYDVLYMETRFFRGFTNRFIPFGKKELVYGAIRSARSYCFDLVKEKLDKKVFKTYPFIFPKGQEKRDGKYLVLNLEKRAGGKEEELKNLEQKVRDYDERIMDDIIKELKAFDSYTFIAYQDKPIYEGLDYYIFGGFEAAENTNFKTFFADFNNNEQPIELLNQLVKRIYKKYKIEIFESSK